MNQFLTASQKDHLLTFFLDQNHPSRHLSLTSVQLHQVTPVAHDVIAEAMQLFEGSGLITSLNVATGDGHYLFVFQLTGRAFEFMQEGGYAGQQQQLKMIAQREEDVAQASISSADSAAKSARESVFSRWIALVAILISIVSALYQCSQP